MHGKKVTYQGALLMSLVFCLWLLVACGSSRQGPGYDDDSVDMDELLGEEDTSAAEGASDEDEVLRLLGITPAEEQPEPVEASAKQGEAMQEMEEDLQMLREDLLDKDQQISELRSRIAQKEQRIEQLESLAKRSRSVRPGVGGEPSPEFRAKYQQALSQFRARNYQSALSSFNELILSDANNSLSDNCQYWIGECYFALGNYNQAIAEFEKVFSYPNSNKNDDAQIMLGQCYLKLGDHEQARAAFSQLISIYPDSEYKSLAQRYIAQL